MYWIKEISFFLYLFFNSFFSDLIVFKAMILPLTLYRFLKLLHKS